jgi:hypothetical protein
MAIYKIFPTKDSTIYSEFPESNTGLDEILECSSYINKSTLYSSRYLIQFSQNEINTLLNNIEESNFKVFLRNHSAIIEGLNTSTQLHIYPVAEKWEMGTGRYNEMLTNGVSWIWKDSQGSEEWETSNFNPYITASFLNNIPGGGTWYTGSNLNLNIIHSHSFSYSSSPDLNVDVTNTILTWHSGAIDNNGFIIKLNEDEEFNTNINNKKILKYFSIDTNTIYPPYLEFKWDDYMFSTGSSLNKIISTQESLISLSNNKLYYFPEEIVKFRLNITPKYPQRKFITGSYYGENFYLPEEKSLYAIKDSKTNEYIIDFDSEFTKISADEKSSYFYIYMNGLEPERYYTILIKTEIEENIIIFDENIMFKVIKG